MIPAIGIGASRLRCKVGVAKGSSDERQSVTVGEAHCGVRALLDGHEVGLAFGSRHVCPRDLGSLASDGSLVDQTKRLAKFGGINR